MRNSLLIAALLLAGCNGTQVGEPSDGSDSTGSTTAKQPTSGSGGVDNVGLPDDADRPIDFSGCTHTLTTIQAPRAVVDELLPAGYKSASSTGDEVTTYLGLHVLDCDVIVTSNSTPPMAGAVSYVATWLVPNPSWNRSEEAHTFVFELYTNSSAVLKRLASWNMTAINATIAGGQNSDGYKWTLNVAGSTRYEVDARLASGSGASTTATGIFHILGPGSPSQGRLTFTGGLASTIPWVTTIQANGGILSQVPPGQTGALLGETAVGETTLSIASIRDASYP